jgi:hypothetical protein
MHLVGKARARLEDAHGSLEDDGAKDIVGGMH